MFKTGHSYKRIVIVHKSNRFSRNAVFAVFVLASLVFGNIPFPIPSFSILASHEGQERHYYLAHWEWHCETEDECYWRSPGGNAMGLVDLRPLPAQGKKEIPEGYGFFAYDQKVSIPGSIYLGDSLDFSLTDQQKAQVRTALNITDPLQSHTIVDILWDTLTVHADPTGQTGPKPLQGKQGSPVQLHLGGHSIIKQESFTEEHRQRAIAVFQADYERNKKAYPKETLQKWTGATMQELYGRMDDDLASEIVPQAYKDNKPLWKKPETTFTDDFGDADFTPDWTVTGGLNWVETGGTLSLNAAGLNEIRMGGTNDPVLSSDNHYAQVTLSNTGTTINRTGPSCRNSTDAGAGRDYYGFGFGASRNAPRLYKVINGSVTDIGVDGSITWSNGDTLKIQVDGSTLTGHHNGTLVKSETDTALTGQLRCGLRARNTADDFDDFEAADLNVAPDDPTSLAQLKSDDTTSIANEGYTEETEVTLKASATDEDTTETLTLFFELVENASSFTSTSTPVVGESCASGTAFADCASKVWYITSSSGDYSVTPFTATSTVAALTDAIGYKWQAKACDDDSACSSWVAFNATTPNFTIDTTAPTAPGTPSTTDPTSDNTPAWTWDASTDDGSGLHATDTYTIQWETDPNFGSPNSATSTSASFTHTTELADDTWYARVKAKDAANNESGFSASSSVLVDTTAPSDPGTPSATTAADNNTPTWEWTVSTDAGAGLHSTEPYTVEWSTDSGFGTTTGTSTVATASFTHTDTLADGTWYFRVKAKDTLDNESAFSANGEIAIDTSVPEPAPSGGGGGGTSGSAAAGTAWLQQQGYLPSPQPPPLPAEAPQSGAEEGTPPSLIERIIPPIFRPAPPSPEAPESQAPPVPVEEIVPQEAPLVFQGQWQLIPSEPIRQFVFAPLPGGIIRLADKFPQLARTLEQVGVSTITDLQRLQAARLTLPGLVEFGQLHADIPTEVVFATGPAEVIDIPAVLTVNDMGEPQQQIRAIAGKPLHLTVKPEQPVTNIKGYLLFTSRTPSATEGIPQNALLASAFFAKPTFAQTYDPQDIETRLVLLEFEYTGPDEQGLWTADIQAPVVEGEYEVLTVIEYEDPDLGTKVLRLVTVVDPEGYVYEKSGDREIRIPGAIVSLYWLNSESKQYELWPAKDYQQENPQVTDVTGRYSFLTPQGTYYLLVEAPGYPVYQGKTFEVKEGAGVHMNIELKTKYWWLSIVDWKVGLLVFVLLLLLLNFWRDRMKKRQS